MSNTFAVSVRPIFDDEDLSVALERLDSVFLAEAGTPEASEREALALMVEAYESKHYSMEPVDPVEALSITWFV